jgi:endonuclease/exonuclease/phosphatase family metal-dependent hydrolase
MRVRVLTLNVWNVAGDPRRAELINEELRRLDPDLVSLQEVPDPTAYDRLDQILSGTDLHRTDQSRIPQETPAGSERYGGNAVATRWPHRLCEALDLRLPDAPDVPWLTLAVSVPVPGEGELLFISTTTAWRLDAEAARERQAVALTDLDARHRRRLPTVIAGDFTATPDAACIRYLTGKQSLAGHSVHYHDAWAAAGDGPGDTWTADNANTRSTTDDAGRTIDNYVGQPNHRRRIDYVLVGSEPAHPEAYARVRSAAVCFDKPTGGLWPSDHFGVVVDLDLGGRG